MGEKGVSPFVKRFQLSHTLLPFQFVIEWKFCGTVFCIKPKDLGGSAITFYTNTKELTRQLLKRNGRLFTQYISENKNSSNNNFFLPIPMSLCIFDPGIRRPLGQAQKFPEDKRKSKIKSVVRARWPIRPELIPVYVAWSDKEYFYSPWMGC